MMRLIKKTEPTLLVNSRLRRFRPTGPIIWYSFLGIIIACFASWQLYQSSQGPVVKFSTPTAIDELVNVPNNIFTLTGSTKNVAYFYINDEVRPTNTDGGFDFDLFTPAGRSTIDIRAEDRYGRSKEYVIEIYNSSPALTESQRELQAASVIEQFSKIKKNYHGEKQSI